VADTDFDPRFGDPLNQLIAAANAQGIKTNVISGRRSAADQQQLYANYQAGLAGKPLPYPDRGPVPLAAKPGTSLHEQGLAADVEASDPKQQAALRALAPQFGLATIGPSDPNHFQIGKTSPAVAVANRASAPLASSGPPAPINPGLTINASPLAGSHAQFIQDYAKSIGLDPNTALGVANAEGLKAWSAKNPNAGSTVDIGPDGKPFSFGDFQLNVRNGMGNQAIAKGIDPRDPNQWQSADRFAMDQMKAGGLNPWKGDAYVQALQSGQTPPVVQAPPATPGTPGTPPTAGVLPGFPNKASSDNFTQGGAGLEKALYGDQSSEEGGGRGAAFNFLPARNVSPLLGQASQIYGNTLNSLATPAQWSSAAPGQNPYASAGGQAVGGQFGTQLGSLQQMQQMMAMMGNPYGDAGYG
jgi:D-alanyl-D-alanine carboxypeptidase